VSKRCAIPDQENLVRAQVTKSNSDILLQSQLSITRVHRLISSFKVSYSRLMQDTLISSRGWVFRSVAQVHSVQRDIPKYPFETSRRHEWGCQWLQDSKSCKLRESYTIGVCSFRSPIRKETHPVDCQDSGHIPQENEQYPITVKHVNRKMTDSVSPQSIMH
jgi:hypothetical protein